MMNCFSAMSMHDMGWMMWAGGLSWLLVVALLLLAAAALVKYLFGDRQRLHDHG